MADRDRLIELIADKWLSGIYDMADHLLANGIIVPPCEIGDTVYVLMETSCEDIDGVYTTCEFYHANKEDLCALPKGKCPYQYRIAECVVSDVNLLRFAAEWGKTVFATRESAERALKECEQ